MDVVIITPEPGRHAEIGQRLLALAAHPYEVRWVTWPTAGFEVSMGVFQAFERDTELIENSEPVEDAVPKKRGRPKKAVASTDEHEKEE